MKKKSFLIMVLVCFFCGSIYAQQQDTVQVASIEQAINKTLASFRERILNKEAVVYCIVKNHLDMTTAGFNNKNLLIEQGINARYIDKKTKNYLLTFGISKYSGGLIVDVSISSVEKKTNKRLEYLVHSFDIPTLYKVVF